MENPVKGKKGGKSRKICNKIDEIGRKIEGKQVKIEKNGEENSIK